MKKRAFTLIELLVVIAILGLIGSVVFVSLKSVKERAKIASVLQYSSTIKKVLGADIVGEWSFEEGSGIQAKDTSGQNNHGALYGFTGNPWMNSIPELGKALSFDGVNDYMETSLNGFPDPMTNITIEFWAKPSDILESGSVLWAVPDDAANRINIHFPWGNGTIFWDFGNISAGGRLTVSWSSGWNNIWAHWIFISGAGVGQKIYRNNVLLASDTDASSFSKGTKTLNIAKYNTVFWEGAIDEVRIYSRALETAEIQKHYAEGVEKRGIMANF